MDYWDTDVYRYYSDPSYARPRKIVDNLKLDWLDVGNKYYSPEVVFFTKADIQEMSGWSEDEVWVDAWTGGSMMKPYGFRWILER